MTPSNSSSNRRRLRVGVAGVALAGSVAMVATLTGLLPASGADSPGDAEVLGVVTSLATTTTSGLPPTSAAPTTAAPTTVAPTTVPPSTRPPAPPTTRPPAPGQYEPTANEVQRAAKALGTQIVHQLTNYEATTSMAALAASITSDPELQAALVTDASALHHSGQWSRGTVEYGQLGGLTADKTSIMVLVSQQVGVGDDVQLTESRTVDVRLQLVDGVWAFDRIADAGGQRVERPADLSPEAAAVVDDSRIRLADSARWDIYRGHTSKTLLRLMAELADVTPYSAQVLSSGHPYHVFETDRVSNHSVGRAIDIYMLGDTRVIDDHNPDSLIYEIVTWAYDRPEVREVGSPWALDGAGGRSFTNQVHHDHVHIGVNNLD